MPESTRFSVVAFVIAAALFDLWRRRIPNWLVLTGLGFALSLSITEAISTGHASSIGRSLLGLLVALAVYVPLYALRAVGAGDVKLMGAIGAFVGVRPWLSIFLLSAIAGGVVALVVVLARGRLLETLRNVGVILRELAQLRAPHRRSPEFDVHSDRAMRLPHGFSIAVGTLLYLSIEGFGILQALPPM